MNTEQPPQLNDWYAEIIRASNADVDLSEDEVTKATAIAVEATRGVEDAVEAGAIHDVTLTFRIPLQDKIVDFNLDIPMED